jgi:hypothetical protein
MNRYGEWTEMETSWLKLCQNIRVACDNIRSKLPQLFPSEATHLHDKTIDLRSRDDFYGYSHRNIR